ncbi:hypothetical protein LNP74_05500 [Klebsiella pneumoniae subsp. pneumoniae]|nr:hypothetical protein [Klebsiella pneumoniae subsp. pneumoniae]
MPGVFNINEPSILFGAPIIAEPAFFLPFVLVPMVERDSWRRYAPEAFSDLVSRVMVSMTRRGQRRRLSAPPVGGELEL